MSLAITGSPLPIARFGDTVSTNDNQSLAKNTLDKGWCGRAICTVKDQMNAAASSIVKTVQGVFFGLGELSNKTNETAAVFRKLQKHTLYMVEYLRDTPDFFAKFIRISTNFVGVVDLVQIAGDVDYFVNKGWQEKNVWNAKKQSYEHKPAESKAEVTGKVFQTAVDTGVVMFWFQHMGFYNLRNVANTVGNTRLFSFVPNVVASIPRVNHNPAVLSAAKAVGELRVFSFLSKVSLTFVVLRALDLMYAFFAIDAAQKMVAGKTVEEKIGSGLYLSSYLAELTISVVIMAGVTNVIALGTLGATCITLALAAFFYRITHDEDPTLAKQNNPAANAV